MLDIDQWIELLGTLYDRWGYLIVFLGSLLENTALLGLFLPGASLALLGAFYAQQGTLQLGWVIFFAWAGTVLGYHADYLLGRLLLTRLLGRWDDSWLGRRLRLAARVRLGGRFLTRHGGKAILLSHVVGHVRSFVALSAGATHMRYRRFLAFELVAALLWNTAFCLLGYFAGDGARALAAPAGALRLGGARRRRRAVRRLAYPARATRATRAPQLPTRDASPARRAAARRGASPG
jgi:membrane protein DedA with SNARE-associated domain